MDTLTQRIVPLTENHLGYAPEFRGIAGYSLAGLFALWAVYQTGLFDRAASVSGSLWFDGFLTFCVGPLDAVRLVNFDHRDEPD